jgi:hypothetical protein
MTYSTPSSWPESRQLADVATDRLVRHCLAEFSSVTLAVNGSCMEPHLNHGERVVLAQRAPRMGDVVLARHAGGLLLHRLIWGPPFAWGEWRTKADRSRLLDGWIRPDQILGTVLEVAGRPVSRRRWIGLRSLAVGLLTRLRQRFSR